MSAPSPASGPASGAPDLAQGDAAGLDRAVQGLYAEQCGAADADALRCWAQLVGLQVRRLAGDSERDSRL